MAFTFFFRDQQVLERAVEHCLPTLAGRNYPRIWDAGAAMGQEPYTLSILFAERMGPFRFQQSPHRCDRHGEYGPVRADNRSRALYPKEELSRLPEGILDKYFEPDGDAEVFA